MLNWLQEIADRRLLKRFTVILAAMTAAAWAAYASVGTQLLGVDDAHIFFVYGKHLAAGYGPVFNIGGEPVEGFTSMLWTLAVAGAHAVFGRPELWLLLASVIAVALAVASLGRYVTANHGIAAGTWVVLAWSIGSPSFVVWNSITLMDTAVWTTLIVLGFVSALSASAPTWQLALILAAMVCCRPESILWGPLLMTVRLLVAASKYGWKRSWALVAPPLTAFLATLLGLTGLRLAVFGYPLPNTFYAKVSHDLAYNLRQGSRYLAGFLYVNPPVLAGLCPAVAGVILNSAWLLGNLSRFPLSKEGQGRVRMLVTSVAVLLGLTVPALTGGDHFALYRFYQPIWPLIILPLLAMVDVLDIEIGPTAGGVTAILVAIAMLATPHNTWMNGKHGPAIQHEFRLAQRGEMIGARLNAMFDNPRPSVGVIVAGGVALEYEGDVVDLMGLNNTAMAHSPGDRYGMKNHAAFATETFFSQQPDLLLPARVVARKPEAVAEERYDDWCNGVLKGLLTSERFLDSYRLALLSPRSNVPVLAWVRRDYAHTVLQREIELDSVALNWPETHQLRQAASVPGSPRSQPSGFAAGHHAQADASQD